MFTFPTVLKLTEWKVDSRRTSVTRFPEPMMVSDEESVGLFLQETMNKKNVQQMITNVLRFTAYLHTEF